MSLPFKIAVLLSGEGMTLQAILDRFKKEADPTVKISVVISDNPNAYGLIRAKLADIPTEIIAYSQFKSKEAYHTALLNCIKPYDPELIVLAGYMRILAASFLRYYPRRIINLHPSLLPKYKGLNTYARALAAGETEHGTSIHLVTEALDAGEIIAQAKINISADETVSSLTQKTKALEAQLYPEIILKIARGTLQLHKRHTLFISDLHLSDETPHLLRGFMNFMKNEAVQADALYILGDLFEVWVGDDERGETAQQVKRAIRLLTQQGVPVYFIKGNRDFLLGKRFANDCNMTLLSDPAEQTLYDQKILLMHGDLLCTDDRHYQRFKKITQSYFLKKCFLVLPYFIRKKIATCLRHKSQHATQTKLRKAIHLDINSKTAARYLARHSASLLIHGHTHRLGIHILTDSKTLLKKRIVLGAWEEEGNALRLYSNGTTEYLSFSLIK